MSGSQLPNLDRIFRDEDEVDFMPSGGSNLAAIFGLQGKVQEPASATKQSHKKSVNVSAAQQSAPISKPEVIVATAIYAYKLQKGSYGPVGKLGLALTGDVGTKSYQLILYKSKQEHISVVNITHEFVYTVQENNYCSYYDANKDNWTILFENTESRDEFAREIALARYFSKDSKIENVLYQDLTPVNKKEEVAKEGDRINIKYFVATEIVQPFKSSNIAPQTMTVEISTDNNWERILLGTSKGLKRVLFLPPSKQISLGPGFPKEKDVMMEVEILEITEGSKASSGNKASIIQRMAKMGQSMLPKQPTSTTTDSEDTEDDVPLKSPRHKRVDTLGMALQKKNTIHESSEETPKAPLKTTKLKADVPSIEPNLPKPLLPAAFTPTWSPTQVQPSYVTTDGQVYSLQPQPITQAIPTMIDPSLNIFLSETRMANAELRMGMCKIADNVQKLLEKFHVLELQNSSTPATEKVAMDTTLKMLLAMNAQTVTKDNGTRRNVEQNTSMDDDTSLELIAARNKISMLEKELKELKEKLVESQEYIKELEAERDCLTLINKKSQVKIQKLETFKKTMEELDEVQTQNSQYEKSNAVMKEKISMLSEEHSALDK